LIGSVPNQLFLFLYGYQLCCRIPLFAIMQNEEGKMVDLYVPRKWYVQSCSLSDNLLEQQCHGNPSHSYSVSFLAALPQTGSSLPRTMPRSRLKLVTWMRMACMMPTSPHLPCLDSSVLRCCRLAVFLCYHSHGMDDHLLTRSGLSMNLLLKRYYKNACVYPLNSFI
jgi:hypothetical protein